MTPGKPKPEKFWLVLWSTGFQCFTEEPSGNSIPVIEESKYLRAIEGLKIIAGADRLYNCQYLARQTLKELGVEV